MSGSLLLTQLLRLLKNGDEKSIGVLFFWIGEILGDILPGVDFGQQPDRVPTTF